MVFYLTEIISYFLRPSLTTVSPLSLSFNNCRVRSSHILVRENCCGPRAGGSTAMMVYLCSLAQERGKNSPRPIFHEGKTRQQQRRTVGWKVRVRFESNFFFSLARRAPYGKVIAERVTQNVPRIYRRQQ